MAPSTPYPSQPADTGSSSPTKRTSAKRRKRERQKEEKRRLLQQQFQNAVGDSETAKWLRSGGGARVIDTPAAAATAIPSSSAPLPAQPTRHPQATRLSANTLYMRHTGKLTCAIRPTPAPTAPITPSGTQQAGPPPARPPPTAGTAPAAPRRSATPAEPIPAPVVSAAAAVPPQGPRTPEPAPARVTSPLKRLPTSPTPAPRPRAAKRAAVAAGGQLYGSSADQAIEISSDEESDGSSANDSGLDDESNPLPGRDYLGRRKPVPGSQPSTPGQARTSGLTLAKSSQVDLPYTNPARVELPYTQEEDNDDPFTQDDLPYTQEGDDDPPLPTQEDLPYTQDDNDNPSPPAQVDSPYTPPPAQEDLPYTQDDGDNDPSAQADLPYTPPSAQVELPYTAQGDLPYTHEDDNDDPSVASEETWEGCSSPEEAEEEDAQAADRAEFEQLQVHLGRSEDSQVPQHPDPRSPTPPIGLLDLTGVDSVDDITWQQSPRQPAVPSNPDGDDDDDGASNGGPEGWDESGNYDDDPPATLNPPQDTPTPPVAGGTPSLPADFDDICDRGQLTQWVTGLASEPEISEENIAFCTTQVRSMLAPFCGCDHAHANENGVSLSTVAAEISARLGKPPSHARDNGTGVTGRSYPLQCPRPSNADFEADRSLNIQGLLAGSGIPDLSLAQEETELITGGDLDPSQMKVARYLDIDSLYMEATSLAALRMGVSLCVLPPFTSVVSQNSHRRLSDNVEPHKCKNIRLLKAGSLLTLELILPHMQLNPEAGQTSALSDDQQRHLINRHVLPAVRSTVPSVVYEQMPQSFDAAVASASASQTKMQASEEGGNRQRTMLAYAIQARYLGPLWDRLRQSMEEEGGKFRGAKLLMQGHDLKNVTFADSVGGMLAHLRAEVLAYIDFRHVIWDRCWSDFGLRDLPLLPDDRAHKGITLLYNTRCLRHLHAPGAPETNPWVGFSPRQYTQYLLRDAGSLELVRDASNPGPLDNRRLVRQLKAYNSHKMIFFTPDKSHAPFRHDRFRSLVLSDRLQADLTNARTGNRSGRAADGAAALRGWENQQGHVYAQLEGSRDSHYGCRREIIINLFVLLRILGSRVLEEGGYLSHHRWMYDHPHPHDPRGTDLLAPRHDQHLPFRVIPTRHLNDLIKANCGRFVVCINRLVSRTWPAGQSQSNPDPIPDALQLTLLRLNLVLATILANSCSSVVLNRYEFIYKSQWRPRRRDPEDEPAPRNGLGLDEVLQRRGMVYFEDNQLEFTLPSLLPEVDRSVHWPVGFRVRPSDPTAGPAPSNYEIVAFNTFVKDYITDFLYGAVEDSVNQHLGTSNTYKMIGRVFQTEMECIVASYNRFLLRSLGKLLARQFRLSAAKFREKVFNPLRLTPNHRDSSRVLSLSDIDRMYILTYQAAGLHKVRDLFCPGNPDAREEDLNLQMPLVCETRKHNSTWSAYIAACLSGLRASRAETAVGWRNTDFVRRYWDADERWTQFADRHFPGMRLLWQKYAKVYAGRFVLITPNFEKTKFIAIQSSVKNVAPTCPKVVYAKWCVPGVPGGMFRENLAPRNVHKLMIRARFYSVLATPGDQPLWLRRYINSGISCLPGRHGGVSVSTRDLRNDYDLNIGESPHVYRTAIDALQFRDRHDHFNAEATDQRGLSSVISPGGLTDAYGVEHLCAINGAAPVASQYLEVLQPFGTTPNVPLPCIWVFAPFQVADNPRHAAFRLLLGKLGWLKCVRNFPANLQDDINFFRAFESTHSGLSHVLEVLPELLDEHVRSQTEITHAALESMLEEQEDELFPGIEDL